jgi:hypothetical protein
MLRSIRGEIMLYIIIFILLLAFILLRRSFKIKKLKQQKKDEVVYNRQKLLIKLKELDKYDLGGYAGDTRDKMKENSNKIQTLMEKIMSDNYTEQTYDNYKNEVYLLEESMKEFSKNLIAQIKLWDKALQALENTRDYTNDFFRDRNFYPPDFTFHANTLESHITDVKEIKRKNPLSSPEPYYAFIEEYKGKFELFLSLHRKISEYIERIENAKTTFTKKDIDEINMLKNDLYSALKDANFKIVEKTLRDLKKYMIRGEKKLKS